MSRAGVGLTNTVIIVMVQDTPKVLDVILEYINWVLIPGNMILFSAYRVVTWAI